MKFGRNPAARLAGQHVRNSVQTLRLQCIIVLGLFMALILRYGIVFGIRSPEFVIADEAALCVCLVVCRFALPLVARRERGARAEEHVGALLAPLTERGWHVIHDARLGSGNVDHILVGPAGVFTLETKSRGGPIVVGRIHGEALRQAHAQRRRVERVTQTAVEPLLVFSHGWVDRPLGRRKGVRIAPARMVVRYVTRRPTQLTPEQVEAVHQRLIEALAAERRSAPLARRAVVFG